MKKTFRKIGLIFVLVILLFLVPIAAQAKPKINKKKIEIIVGERAQLKIIGTKKKVNWSSSNKKVASVNKNGNIIAKKKGTTVVTAKIGKKKYNCRVTVKYPAIKLSEKSKTLIAGESFELVLKNTKYSVKWSVSNKSVVKLKRISKYKYRVSGLKKGKSKITVKVGKEKYECKVTVKSAPQEIPVADFSLNYYGLMIKEGETQKISTYINPSNATNKSVQWYSSNNLVATVNSDGFVTGKSLGKATITAVCGGKKATCEVEVGRNFNEQEAERQLTYATYPTEDGVVVTVKNNYKYMMDLSVDCLYYNSNGVLVGKTSESCYALESGKECALQCISPYDSNYETVEYSSYKIVFHATETNAIGNSSAIQCTGNFGAENVMVSVKNNGQRVSTTQVAVVFYKSGKIIGYECNYAEVNNVGDTDYLQFNFPYDLNYDTIYPDNFKIYVNASYRYDWE